MTQDPSKPSEPNQPQSTEDALPNADLSNGDTASETTLSDSALELEMANTLEEFEEIVEEEDFEETVEELEELEELEEAVEEVLLEAGTLEVIEEAEELEEETTPAANQKPQTATSATSATTTPTAVKPAGKVQAFLRLVGQLWGIVLAGLPILISLLQTVGRFALKVLQWLWNLWRGILPRLRTILPAGLNQFPDWVLTTITFSLVILTVSLFTQLLPAKTPSIAETEPIPPKLVAPAPVPDPDQIARLQNQVSEVTNQYAEGLIEAVQANLQQGRLRVQVSDIWYGLDTSYQDKVATEILKRSRRLDFTKLEITDSEGTLVARNPVVGSEVVVYGRTKDEG